MGRGFAETLIIIGFFLDFNLWQVGFTSMP